MSEINLMSDNGEIAARLLMAAEEEYQRAIESRYPSRVYRPKVFKDGNQWCALYGSDLQEGVAGFGDSPERAMADFDRHWWWSDEQIAKAKEQAR